jgi:hypothetical protein
MSGFGSPTPSIESGPSTRSGSSLLESDGMIMLDSPPTEASYGPSQEAPTQSREQSYSPPPVMRRLKRGKSAAPRPTKSPVPKPAKLSKRTRDSDDDDDDGDEHDVEKRNNKRQRLVIQHIAVTRDAQHHNNTAAELAKELERLQRQHADASGTLETLTGQLSQFEAKQRKAAVAKIGEANRDTEAKIRAKNGENQGLRRQIEDLRLEVAEATLKLRNIRERVLEVKRQAEDTRKAPESPIEDFDEEMLGALEF